jgi:hypothetical protein
MTKSLVVLAVGLAVGAAVPALGQSGTPPKPKADKAMPQDPKMDDMCAKMMAGKGGGPAGGQGQMMAGDMMKSCGMMQQRGQDATPPAREPVPDMPLDDPQHQGHHPER